VLKKRFSDHGRANLRRTKATSSPSTSCNMGGSSDVRGHVYGDLDADRRHQATRHAALGIPPDELGNTHHLIAERLKEAIAMTGF
jgi:hypothetical protein